jgi:hypothetical protein
MDTRSRQAGCTFEARLAQIRLTPAQRAEALAAMRTAEKWISAVQFVGVALGRLTEFMVPKRRVRA